jgi:hypothetical protein
MKGKLMNLTESKSFGRCRKLLQQIRKLKDSIMSDVRTTLNAPEHLLRLALNEAEALAWQSGVPHLVFPTLAMEKVQALSAWQKHQQLIRRGSTNPYWRN